MEEKDKRLTCSQARELDLVQFLHNMGFSPSRIRGHNFWYHSPLRQEKTPSFKVNRVLNRWYDFGIGKGGSILDFGILYFGCSLPDLLKVLAGESLAPIAPAPTLKTIATQVIIQSVMPLEHPALFAYLQSRKIPTSLACRFCKEVVYQNGAGTYFAIGFENDLGGYELRSSFFKCSSSPKGITQIESGSDVVLVFEGFIDFLSYMVLTDTPSAIAMDFIILNGLGFFQTALPRLESYRQVNLFLDNDKAGQNCSRQAVSSNPQKFTAFNELYRDAKDLNEYLCKGYALDQTALHFDLKPP